MSERTVPEVRFRGFSGEWESKLFSGVFDTTIPNNTLSRANLNYENGEVKNIHYGDVLIKFGEITNVKKANMPFITDLDIAKYKGHFLADGDIIFADTAEDATVGKATEITGIDEEKVVAGLHTIPARPRNLKPVGYLGYYINSDSYHKQLLALMQGIKVLSISKRNLANTSISYPFLDAEQTQIGEFFKKLDDLIAQNQKKYDKLVHMKKACFDKMFPKDGADTPEVRFRGFGGEWEVFKLGDLGICSGGTSIEAEFCSDGIYKVISIGSYSEDSIYREQGLRVKPNEKTLSRLLNKYDLTMVLNDKTASGRIIGRTLLIDANDSYVYNQRTQRIQPHHETFDAVFLYQMLNAPNIRNKIFKQSQGNTQIYVNWTGIENILYYIPEKAEQTQTGTYFQTLDNLITLRKTELEKLKNIKKACLDKMFI